MALNLSSAMGTLGLGAGQGAGANQNRRSEIHQLVQELKNEGASTEQIKQAFQQAEGQKVSPLETLQQLQQTLGANGEHGVNDPTGSPGTSGVDQFTAGEADGADGVDDSGQQQEQPKAIFTPEVETGQIVGSGEAIGKIHIQQPPEQPEQLQSQGGSHGRRQHHAGQHHGSGMSLVDQQTGNSISIDGDGSLKAPGKIEIMYIAPGGELHPGQLVLTLKNLDSGKIGELQFEQEGSKASDATKEYQQYLQKHPNTPLKSQIQERMAKLNSQQEDSSG